MKLCLWEKDEARCTELIGHNSNVSKLAIDDNNIALSAGYDSSLLVWDLNSRTSLHGLFGAHHGACLEFAWRNSLVVSGDKAGVLAFWDINRSEPLRVAKGHGSAIG